MRELLHAGFLVAVFVVVHGCGTVTPTPTPPPTPTADCAAFCAHGAELGCSWAAPTPKGATCAEWCSLTQSGPVPMSLGCSVQAASCAAVDACNR